MKISATGAAVGALVGAIGRALVVVFWLGFAPPLFLVLPSAGIGLLVGAIAGSSKKPWLGALVGFLLSAFVFELFMFACASAIGSIAQVTGEQGTELKVLIKILPYTLLMGVAGAAAGGLGSVAGLYADQRTKVGDQPSGGK